MQDLVDRQGVYQSRPASTKHFQRMFLREVELIDRLAGRRLTKPFYCLQWATVFQIRRAPCRGMECTARAALRADALAAPARTSWFRQRFALASPARRQRFALAPLFGSVHALCHTPPALRAGSAELLAAISASRCMLRSTVPAHGSSQSALRSRAPRGCCHGDRLRVLSLCNRSWNFGSMSLEFKVILNFRQTRLFIQNRSKFIQNRSKSILLL